MQAERSGLLLEFSAPAGCPGRAQVLDEIASLVRADRHGGSGRLLAQASVERRAARHFELHVVLTREGARDERSVPAESCAAAAHAVALLVALVLDPQLMSAAPSPPPTAASVRAAPRERPGARPTLELGAALSLDSAVSPQVAVGPALQAGVGWGRLHLALRGRYLLPSSARHDGPSGLFDASFTLADGSLSACHLWASQSLALGPCLAVEAGRLAGRATGLSPSTDGSALWMAVAAAAQGRGRLASWSWLFAELGAEYGLRRPRFEVGGIGLAHQPAALSLIASFGALFMLQ